MILFTPFSKYQLSVLALCFSADGLKVVNGGYIQIVYVVHIL